jgi:diamine N-acetyltransferase
VRAVCELEVGADQRAFVAPNAVSRAEAYAHPEALPRAIDAGVDPVGPVTLGLAPERAGYAVWRLMTDARHQGRRDGAAAMRQVVEHVRTFAGARTLLLSFVDAAESPEGF